MTDSADFDVVYKAAKIQDAEKKTDRTTRQRIRVHAMEKIKTEENKLRDAQEPL